MARFSFDVQPNTVKIIRNSLDNGTDVFVNVRAKGETRIFWASDWDIERGEGSSAYELRFGEQEYTVNEMKQNIVILNKSDKPQHVLIELQEIEYVRPFPVSATTGLPTVNKNFRKIHQNLTKFTSTIL